MQEPIPNFLFYFPFFTLLNVKEKMSTVLVTIIVIWTLRFYVMYWKSTIIIITNHQQHSKSWKELSAIEWRVIKQTLICAVEKLTMFESMELQLEYMNWLMSISETQGLGYKRFNYPTKNHLRAKAASSNVNNVIKIKRCQFSLSCSQWLNCLGTREMRSDISV